ncbi:MAG: hypothetical protein CMF62_01280 [Magnetococcales bacterium]|nr:hypothetical protein [Magnetococcales bacterium]MBA42626.1 hypothetical protein [Magnetococcales bacterium]|tara:strand:+ start:7614 stop:8528 length:915 start_codon:yes stop_codon:yes gene_type:complete
MSEKTINYIICFDFDKTLTSVHSKGSPSLDVNYFTNLDKLKKVLDVLSKSHKLYIVTRGIEEIVKKYLEKVELLEYFIEIYGAIDREHLSRLDWPQQKVQYLDKIMELEKCKKSDMYFFDDTEENIFEAIKNSYINSYVVKKNGYELLNNLNLYLLQFNNVSKMIYGSYKLINIIDISEFAVKEQILGLEKTSQTMYFLEGMSKDNYKYKILVSKNELVGMNTIPIISNILVNYIPWNNLVDPKLEDIIIIKTTPIDLISSYYLNTISYLDNMYTTAEGLKIYSREQVVYDILPTLPQNLLPLL